MIHILVKEY
jgi:hypothetical protein